MSLNDEDGTVEYTVRFTGDTWEHSEFRETLTEVAGGELVSEVVLSEEGPDEDAEECAFPGCDRGVHNFDDPFPVFVPHEDFEFGADLVMCDAHHVSARILAHTKEEPPFVDVGLYPEVTAYARQMAAFMLEHPNPEDVIDQSGGED